jgi:hypothetical protein
VDGLMKEMFGAIFNPSLISCDFCALTMINEIRHRAVRQSIFFIMIFCGLSLKKQI